MERLAIDFEEAEYAGECGDKNGGENKGNEREHSVADKNNERRPETDQKLSDRDRSQDFVFVIDKLGYDEFFRHQKQYSMLTPPAPLVLKRSVRYASLLNTRGSEGVKTVSFRLGR
jgi:hypothetical protein